MFQHTLPLCLILTLIVASCSADPVQVVSGVFMVNNTSLDYDGAKVACESSSSTLATLEQITNAYNHGYKFDKWGWVEERMIVILRGAPLPCSKNNVATLIKDCTNVRFTFCAIKTGAVYELPINISNYSPGYDNASMTCSENGLNIATKEQIEGNIKNLTNSRPAWYNFGVGQINEGTFELNVCDEKSSQASPFCYNSTLPDVLIVNDTKMWKKIAIGCLIALVFVILLTAAIFMRGNRFVCCIGKENTHPAEVPQPPLPTWNKTSVYRHVGDMNQELWYNTKISIKNRPPVIRPDMSIYKTHYDNVGFEAECL
ncbi:uncharacterized protein LOC142103916 [Mixophyes fleayi]|uniref:uncharacterized protein LOC142103916 n=1 Tax=Mixophyes fleayi TaxID=3061075 RepID=UPI003F4DAD5A